MRIYRDLLKHSSVYGIGQILSRIASILLLPVYTHFLRPADYGVIAILDLVTVLLAILIGSGMAAAVNRFHFEDNSPDRRSTVWWTGLAFVSLTATVIVLPCWLAKDAIAYLAVGPETTEGSGYVALALMTVWFTCVGELPDTYLRVRKWSGLYVGLSLFRLLLNIALNVSFLAVWGLGVKGVLLGNLITGGVMTAILCCVLATHERRRTVDMALMRRLLAFGAPLIAAALLATVMHQADRYLLRLFLDMHQVGLYSLAYQIGQGVNTLCLLPFAAIWSVVMYEIAARPDAKQVFAQIFEYFVYGLALVLFAASLFAEPILSVLTAPDYVEAAGLIPVICLAYLFFSLHEHFRVPVLLAKRTLNLIPVYAVAAILNVVSNLILIPQYGAAGAAWSSVVTFGAFSFFGLYRYRRVDRYPYPLFRCAEAVAGLSLTYVACRQVSSLSTLWGLVASAVAFLVWAVLLFGSVLLGELRRRRGAFWTQTTQPIDPVAKGI